MLHKSMGLTYEPASEPLHISVKYRIGRNVEGLVEVVARPAPVVLFHQPLPRPLLFAVQVQTPERGVRGVGCGVWDVGCGVWGVGCGVWGLVRRVHGAGFRVEGW